MRKRNGFTLIEIMVAISVLAILMSVGVPSMVDFARNNRRAAAVNALVTDIQQARGDAASAGVDTVLCHSGNGTSCSGSSNPDWSDGWLLFSDLDADGGLDAGEPILARHEKRDGITMPSNRTRFRFRPGFRSATNGTVAVCVDGGSNRWVTISIAGRPRLQEAQPLGVSAPVCPAP